MVTSTISSPPGSIPRDPSGTRRPQEPVLVVYLQGAAVPVRPPVRQQIPDRLLAALGDPRALGAEDVPCGHFDSACTRLQIEIEASCQRNCQTLSASAPPSPTPTGRCAARDPG